MNDVLTTAEKIFIEHWSVRRISMLKRWLFWGCVFWGGGFSVFALYDISKERSLPLTLSLLVVVVSLVGGALFGLGMWGVTEIRYRRLAKRSTSYSPNKRL